MGFRILPAGLVGLLLCAATVWAGSSPPGGLIAVSVDDVVVVVDPSSGATRSIPTGPVAWLFPAPGGTLFAPDLVHGATTVVDLRNQTVREPLEGITMPHFGSLSDRYVVVARQVLVVSYPDRALLNRFEIAFEKPWQVAVEAGNTVLLVLERDPEGAGGASLAAVNLSEGRLVYRRPLGNDVRHFALSPLLGAIALADATAGRVVIADPATLTPRAMFEVAGRPVDLAFADDGSLLAVATESEAGAGELLIWKIKQTKDGHLERKKQWQVPLGGRPIRVAVSPERRHVAVGLAEGRLQVVNLIDRVSQSSFELPGPPRDVVWCDPSTPGPEMPDWSDDDPPSLGLGEAGPH